LKDLSAGEFARVSELLDSCLALAPQERTDWLSRLESEDLPSAAILRRLFATSDATGFGSLPETSEILTRHLVSLIKSADTLAGRRVGPYRVLSLLGQGGMGSVWLAERADGLFARQVALKLVHPVLVGRQVTERFAREREILASLSHPNIARLFDAGLTDDGQPFLALQYVAGKPITTYCDERQLTLQERLQLFLQVLSAVQYAHAHLIIHRDLKPSNILVTAEGEVQLLDFGIAKLLTAGEARETELTHLGGRALTPDYAAPEQIAGGPITTAVDVYALGVILYELLSGERPYRLKRDSRGALEEAILAADLVAPSRVAPSERAAQARGTTPARLIKALRGDLDTIATKALKKSPAERYATANAFGEDVARFLRGDVVVARRDSVAYRAFKFARRHRVGISAVSILIVTLAAGLAATTYEAKVAATQRDAALEAQRRSLTQTAAARLKDGDIPSALTIIREVLLAPRTATARPLSSEAARVFQEARASDAQLLALIGHTDWVRSAAFSPDGRRIVTASQDTTARIWDANTGYEVAQLRGHTDRVGGAAFSPDGSRIVTASADRTVRVWDAATGRETLVLRGHTAGVRSAEFSPDGRQIVTASGDHTARIWDAVTAREGVRLLGHTDRVTAARFSPDGSRIITGSFDKTARIWDATSGRELVLLRGHSDLVTDAEFAPDGRHVITTSYDKTARIWDAKDGRKIMQLAGHSGQVWSANYSQDGSRVVTSADDKTARIWDMATGRQLALLSGHTDLVETARFSPDGRRVVTASNDRTARIWDVVPNQQIMVLSGHTGAVQSASFSPDGQHLVTASSDKTSRIWDAATGREEKVLGGHPDWVASAAFSADGRRVVTASYDRTARVWDVVGGQMVAQMVGHTEMLGSAVFSPDGSRVATASDDKTARVWDATTGHQLLILRGHADRVWSAAFSGDGQHIVTASADKTVRIWDALTGRESALLRGHGDLVSSAIFSPDGRRIVTASADHTARIWDASEGGELQRLDGHTEGVVTAAFSADGQRIVTASEDHTARIWNSANALQVAALLGHTDRVQSAAFSPDGTRVVTASDDGTARIWDARLPALGIQIDWTAAAQFDPLSKSARFQLGLPEGTDGRQWSATRSKCDEAAAAPYDPDRRAAGVPLEAIVSDIAVTACAVESGDSARKRRSLYQRGRALMAAGNFRGARQDLEKAVAQGYRAGYVDLGMLLSQPSAAMIDVPKTLALYERAWNEGVTIAAFDLGSLYEHGVRRGGDTSGYLLAPDEARAWTWYRKGADAEEPNALARFGEKADQAAFAESDPAKRKAHLLESFKYYAAAAERARTEDWPDDAWRDWRYRRASVARILAREGMMQQIADTYDGIRAQYSPPTHSLWQRLVAITGLE
jgi:WD40 repeat protein